MKNETKNKKTNDWTKSGPSLSTSASRTCAASRECWHAVWIWCKCVWKCWSRHKDGTRQGPRTPQHQSGLIVFCSFHLPSFSPNIWRNARNNMEVLRKSALYIVERNSGRATFLQSPFCLIMFWGFFFHAPCVLGCETIWRISYCSRIQAGDRGWQAYLFFMPPWEPNTWRSAGHVKATNNYVLWLIV